MFITILHMRFQWDVFITIFYTEGLGDVFITILHRRFRRRVHNYFTQEVLETCS